MVSAQTLAQSWLQELAQRINPDAQSDVAERHRAYPLDRWLAAYFPRATRSPMAERHRRLWGWFEALEPGVKPTALVELWPRGGAKSATAELGTARVGAKLTRNFCLYVSGTQAQANKHVNTIASRFEALGIGRAVNRYGHSLGWRLDMLRTDNGFAVLALGLDAAARGIRIEDFRPDLIVLDDIDERHDSKEAVEKKIATITETVLPTGAPDAAVLFVQNIPHADSIAAKLADGSADFLLQRTVHVEPAVEGLRWEWVEMPEGPHQARITAGEATWEGQSLEVCERQMNEWGPRAFLREAQHKTDADEAGLWSRALLDATRIRRGEVPRLVRVAVAVDPPGGGTEAGIVVGGVDAQGRGYLLLDATTAAGEGPHVWAGAVASAYELEGADVVVAETNYGGDMVKATLRVSHPTLPVKEVRATRGKQVRAEPVATLHEERRIFLAGHFPELERELVTWQPSDKDSPNRLDAFVWLFTELLVAPRRVLHSPGTRSMVTPR